MRSWLYIAVLTACGTEGPLTASQYDEQRDCWEDTTDSIPDFPWGQYYRACRMDTMWWFADSNGRCTALGSTCPGGARDRIVRRANLGTTAAVQDECESLFDDQPFCPP